MAQPDSSGMPCDYDRASSEPDPWEPWTDRQPRLRIDSFTARQLSYLSPQAVHLESRRTFIGDFPDGWIEQNCPAWMANVQNATDNLDAADDEQQNQINVQPNSQKSNPTPLESLLPNLVPQSQSRDSSASSNPSTKAEKSELGLRAKQEKDMVNNITNAAIVNEQQAIAQRKSIADKRRHLLSRFHHKALREAPMEVVDQSDDRPYRSTNSDMTSTISSNRTRISPNIETASSKTTTAESLRSVQTMYYDCNEELHTNKATKCYHSKPLVSIANPPIASIHHHPEDTEDDDGSENFEDAEEDNQEGADVSRKQSKTDCADKQSQNETEKDKQSFVSLSRTLKLANLKRRAHVRFSHHRNRPLVYQGRYLIEVRESTAARPVVSEKDAPLATSLESRWKEYAIFAKYTGNVQRPLCLYFYDVVKEAKLTRRAKRAWSRSLDFKIILDPYYELKIFSPLDLTMALWRPHRRTEKGRERKRKTKIIILHAQSISSIWDISFLIDSVVKAPSTRQMVHRHINVGVPTIDVEVQLMIDSRSHHCREIRRQSQSTITYEELRQPLVATSPTLKLIVGKVWDAVRSLPRRYYVSSAEAGTKFALAWQQGSHCNRQLWVPSMSNEMTLVTRLFWLMQPCGNLSLLVPEPRCYEGELVEPSPVEGYCVTVGTVRHYSKGGTLNGKLNQQYLSTHDYLLFYVSGARAQPPMLASGQTALEKLINPYPLDENNHIKWIKESTCLREIDHHDTIARLELERRTDLISNSRGFIDLRYTDKIVADGSVAGQLIIQEGGGGSQYRLQFPSQSHAAIWEKRLNDIVTYWRAVHSAELLRRVAGTHKPMSITPYVANRTILHSGPLFFKKHRFTTFNRFPVILTSQGLVVFRINESNHHPPTNPNSPAPAAAYDFRHHATFDLKDSYIYTGQLAKHALLDDDKHIDPNNPGVRALPRAYEDSWVSQDTELDRCFVIWKPRQSRIQRLLRTTGTGSYMTFLARDKYERDHWVTAIRYVQSALASKRKEEVINEDENETDFVDSNLSNKL